MFLGVAGFDDRPATPIYLVMARGDQVREMGGGMSLGAGRLEDVIGFGPDADNRKDFVYRRLLRERTDQCQVEGRAYSLTNGRVFLLDLSDDKRRLWQINTRLGGFFDNPSPDRDAPGTYFSKLAAEIESLQKADPRVRRFWDGEHPDVEEN
jgi:hypothetical protein